VNFSANINADLGCYHKATCHGQSVAEHSSAFGKYVRLNLIGEIVEVVSYDTTEITIKYRGGSLTMQHFEVSRLTPEEETAAAYRISG
jgi:hypothetical protein